MLDFIFYYFPFLLPNNDGDHKGRHDVDKGHLVSHDFRLGFKNIVEENGFRFQSHQTETEDGYVLTMYRIRDKKTEDGAPVVFL